MLADITEHILHHAGVRLMACHGRGAVVEHDDEQIHLVENRVGKSGHAGMEERGVADETDHGLACGKSET